MKIALVHDYLNQYGGAERVLEVLHQIWPEAPIYTSLIDYQKMKQQGFNLDDKEVKTSFMQKLPFKNKLANSYFLPLYPLAFERFDLKEYDVVLSITSYAAKGVITHPHTTHICYCCTPTRHLWYQEEYLKHHAQVKPIHKPLLYPLLNYLRIWDITAASRVDHFVAISQEVKSRIKKTYNRDSEVIYPPVNLDRFLALNPQKTDPKKGFFLIVSRLGGHKRIDLAIQAFNNLGISLKIIGDGPQKGYYQKMAGSNIEFLGRLSDKEVDSYYEQCLGFIYPQEEDFGITAIEAQAAGKGVVAYQKGGATETVIDGETGAFFRNQTPVALAEAVLRFLKSDIKPERCRENAQKFSEAMFKKEIEKLVESKAARVGFDDR